MICTPCILPETTWYAIVNKYTMIARLCLILDVQFNDLVYLAVHVYTMGVVRGGVRGVVIVGMIRCGAEGGVASGMWLEGCD